MPIETFEQFIKRILEILFWALLLLPMFVFPILFLLTPYIPLPYSISELLSDPLLLVPMIDWLVKTDFFKVAVFPGFTTAALYATFLIWYERKLLAKINLRIGPLYAGRVGGILQPIADLFKLLFKEIIVPKRADKPFFMLAPPMTFAVAAALLSVIPLGEDIVVAHSNVGVLVIFAVIGFFPIIVLVASWASNNKFSFIGGLRALHQLISFEIPLLISVVSVVVLARSLDLVEIVKAQSNVWFILPLLIGAAVFYISVLAELERIPFDLPEADTEIVAGWLTEYTSMNYGLMMLAIYIKLYALAGLFTTLFLGGWSGPAPMPPTVWFFIKTFIVTTLIVLPRGFNPRVRIDQLIRLGWAWLIMLSLINLFIAFTVAALGVV